MSNSNRDQGKILSAGRNTQDRTEPVEGVAVTSAVTEVEHAGTASTAIVAPTPEERIARVREARVVAMPAVIHTCTTR